MRLDFTTEQDELRAGVRALLERECPMSAVRALAEHGTPLEELWAHMVELGWPALTIPESADGLGLGFVEVAVVAEELGRAVAPGPWLPTVSQFVPAVREVAGEAAPRDLLAGVASGERTGTLAIAEATGSFDVADVETVVEPVGEGWRLHGSKHYVLEGDAVTDTVVVGRLPDTAGDEGITAVLVPIGALVTERIASFDRTRAVVRLRAEGVVVPGDAVLGEPGAAAPAVRRALEEATTALTLEMVGTAQTIFDVILTYAKERHQFGVPIGSFQAIKHKFSDMYVLLERARALAYFATATIAEDDERRASATSMAKAAVGDAQRRIAKEGIQVLGGIGYTWEHDMHLYVRRLKSGNALFGTEDEHLARIADSVGV